MLAVNNTYTERDLIQIYNHIITEQREAGERKVDPKKIEYLCTVPKKINSLAERNNYSVYQTNSIDPRVYLIGLKIQQKSIKDICSLVSEFAKNKIFQEFNLLSEGYTVEAILFCNLHKPLYQQLDKVYQKNNLKSNLRSISEPESYCPYKY